jgi:hypothetical protein
MKTLGLIRIIGAAAAPAAAVVTLAFAATVGQAARPPVIAWSPVTSPGIFDYDRNARARGRFQRVVSGLFASGQVTHAIKQLFGLLPPGTRR